MKIARARRERMRHGAPIWRRRPHSRTLVNAPSIQNVDREFRDFASNASSWGQTVRTGDEPDENADVRKEGAEFGAPLPPVENSAVRLRPTPWYQGTHGNSGSYSRTSRRRSSMGRSLDRERFVVMCPLTLVWPACDPVSIRHPTGLATLLLSATPSRSLPCGLLGSLRPTPQRTSISKSIVMLGIPRKRGADRRPFFFTQRNGARQTMRSYRCSP